MSKWVTEDLENLLQEINEVPYTDNRESQQLTILMHGFSQLNNKVMDKAAVRTKIFFEGWNLDPEKGPLGETSNDDSTEIESVRSRPFT